MSDLLKYTAYGIFFEALWNQHKSKYSVEHIQQEISDFHVSCSKWWYDLNEKERLNYQKISNELNRRLQLNESIQVQKISVSQSTPTEIDDSTQLSSQVSMDLENSQSSISSKFAKPMMATSCNQKEVHEKDESEKRQDENDKQQDESEKKRDENDIQDESEILQDETYPNYSSGNEDNVEPPKKKTKTSKKDPNAPKKPLSAFFRFSIDERKNLKEELKNPISVTDTAKLIGQRWNNLNPLLKQGYEDKYQEEKVIYDQAMFDYKSQKLKKAKKSKLTGYIVFAKQERENIKKETPNLSMAEIAKELGRRWSQFDKNMKQSFSVMAQEKNEATKEQLDLA